MSYQKNIAADTNVLFSGLFYRGPPNSLIKAVQRGETRLHMSEYLRDELVEVVRGKAANIGSVAAFLNLPNVRVIADSNYDSDDFFGLAAELVRDKKDWPVFAFAKFSLERQLIDFFVTGDKDLLTPNVRRELKGKIVTVNELFGSGYL